MFQYFLPSPIAVKVEVTGKVLDDEGDAEDDENDGERYCQDWYADIFFKNKHIEKSTWEWAWCGVYQASPAVSWLSKSPPLQKGIISIFSSSFKISENQ